MNLLSIVLLYIGDLLQLNQRAWNPWWFGVIICAFAGVISLFHINSYVADKKKLNGWFLWGGIFLLALAAFFLYMTSKTSTGQPG